MGGKKSVPSGEREKEVMRMWVRHRELLANAFVLGGRGLVSADLTLQTTDNTRRLLINFSLSLWKKIGDSIISSIKWGKGEAKKKKEPFLSCSLLLWGISSTRAPKLCFSLGFFLLIGVAESGYRHLRGNKACGLLTGLVLISRDLTRVTLELQHW